MPTYFNLNAKVEMSVLTAPCTYCGEDATQKCTWCDSPYCDINCQNADKINHRGICLRRSLNKKLLLIPPMFRNNPAKIFLEKIIKPVIRGLTQIPITHNVSILLRTNEKGVVSKSVLNSLMAKFNQNAARDNLSQIQKFSHLYATTHTAIQKAKENPIPVERGHAIVMSNLVRRALGTLVDIQGFNFALADAAVGELQLNAFNINEEQRNHNRFLREMQEKIRAQAKPGQSVENMDGGYRRKRYTRRR